MGFNPHTVLATLCYIYRTENSIWHTLMHERKAGEFQQGFWIPFGGKYDLGESGEACVKREILEETGLELICPVLRGRVLFDNRERIFNEGKVYPNNLVDIYECPNFKGELKKGCPGVWVPQSHVRTLNMSPGDLLLLDWVNKPDAYFFSGLIRYKGKEVSQSEVTFYFPHNRISTSVEDYPKGKQLNSQF